MLLTHWLSRLPSAICRIILVLTLVAVLAACQPHERSVPVVLAASSLQEALDEAAQAFADTGHELPLLSFASSASLARQIERGAPADLFISADAQWMDWLEQRGQLNAGTRVNLLTGKLVLIAGLDVPGAWNGSQPLRPIVGAHRIAVAELETVPAGRYAKQTLISSGDWEAVQRSLVPSENVRAALALVERGETDFGIVYASDAQASSKVRLLGAFSDAVQPAIVYPAALLAASRNADAGVFLAFLRTEQANKIFRRHGFGVAS